MSASVSFTSATTSPRITRRAGSRFGRQTATDNMSTIVREIIGDLLHIYGFATLEELGKMSIALEEARRELALEKKGVDELIAEQGRQVRWTSHFAAQNARLRKFVSEIAAASTPNAPKFGAVVHNLDRLHDAAMTVLRQTKELKDGEEPG